MYKPQAIQIFTNKKNNILVWRKSGKNNYYYFWYVEQKMNAQKKNYMQLRVFGDLPKFSDGLDS